MNRALVPVFQVKRRKGEGNGFAQYDRVASWQNQLLKGKHILASLWSFAVPCVKERIKTLVKHLPKGLMYGRHWGPDVGAWAAADGLSMYVSNGTPN
jgi:hypothetical protein